jgi:hypothetical protein
MTEHCNVELENERRLGMHSREMARRRSRISRDPDPDVDRIGRRLA